MSKASSFQSRHIGPQSADIARMLKAVGYDNLDALVDGIVPSSIRRAPLEIEAGDSEAEYFSRLQEIGARNALWRTYIGLGYYGTVTPAVIARNVFENPGWYTPYTPYQAEIAQGRLESLLNFQTMVTDLTGMEIANASLLDEATAAAEAVGLMARVRRPSGTPTVLVSERVFPQVLAVLLERLRLLGLHAVVGDLETMAVPEDVVGAYAQSPDSAGAVVDVAKIAERVHAKGGLVAVGTDLLGCAVITPPGELGADIVVGNAQRFGVPLGYGGPHAAFFATREKFVRQMPGRLIGVSVDANGRRAYRMAIQTREQHIRREKATSNICTAQALLANMAAFYAVFHGADGIRAIAERIHDQAVRLSDAVSACGFVQANDTFFDTLSIEVDSAAAATIRASAEHRQINLQYSSGRVGVAIDETTTERDLQDLADVFSEAAGRAPVSVAERGEPRSVPERFRRRSAFLTHAVFNSHHSETEMMRYIRRLERKDLGLDSAMIPLGSCTMKLNAAAEMMPVSWPEFSRMHPFVPVAQAAGYAQIFSDLERTLAEVTGLPGVSLQPNSGAQGEFAGLLVIRAYQASRGEEHRDVALIPQSAHGTNPASAVLAGLSVVIVACDNQGNIDLDDLAKKAETHRDRLSCLMVTYPSTHGVFETKIQDVCAIVHAHGGQVYMDGANMNAQVGVTSPRSIGADVCHINLHKTFAIPHGGGGPGMGPIAVAEHLRPFLPGHPLVATGGDRAIPPVSAAPWGSANILYLSCHSRLMGMTTAILSCARPRGPSRSARRRPAARAD